LDSRHAYIVSYNSRQPTAAWDTPKFMQRTKLQPNALELEHCNGFISDAYFDLTPTKLKLRTKL